MEFELDIENELQDLKEYGYLDIFIEDFLMPFGVRSFKVELLTVKEEVYLLKVKFPDDPIEFKRNAILINNNKISNELYQEIAELGPNSNDLIECPDDEINSHRQFIFYIITTKKEMSINAVYNNYLLHYEERTDKRKYEIITLRPEEIFFKLIRLNVIEEFRKSISQIDNYWKVCLRNRSIRLISREGFEYNPFIDYEENYQSYLKKTKTISADSEFTNQRESIIIVEKSKFSQQGRDLIDLSALKIGIFYAFTLQAIAQEIKPIIQKFSKDSNANLHHIESLEKLQSISLDVMIFILALDEPKKGMSELLKHCKNRGIPFIICIPDERYRPEVNQIRVKKLASIMNAQRNLKKKNDEFTIRLYKSTQEISEYIYTFSQSIYIPNIYISKLTLLNVGNFNDSEIKLDPKVTCIVGENGSGKSTILKSIISAIIGYQEDNILKTAYSKMIRISGLDKDGYPIREIANISLEYSINGRAETAFLKIGILKNGIIRIQPEGNEKFKIGEYFRILIIGFSQKKIEKNMEGKVETNPNLPPNVEDLIPFIKNEYSSKIDSFAKWISELDAMANKKEKDLVDKDAIVAERILIEDTFQIISEIANQKIEFLNVLKQSTSDVWIKTPSSPAISIKMISQGFESIMEWIGHFMQRMSQAYPFSKDFRQERAICLIDEIDTYLHPIFQNRIIGILTKNFPNTQFIITTHSPLVVGGLKKEQVIELKMENNEIQVGKPIFSPYGAAVGDILETIMHSDERLELVQNELSKLFSLIQENKLAEALEIKRKLVEEIGVDPKDSKILQGEMMIRTKLARQQKA